MRRVLHLVRSEPAALPAGAVAGGDTVVYTQVPDCLPPVSCFRWCPDTGAAARTGGDSSRDQASEHVPHIDSQTLCELVFAADSVVVW